MDLAGLLGRPRSATVPPRASPATLQAAPALSPGVGHGSLRLREQLAGIRKSLSDTHTDVEQMLLCMNRMCDTAKRELRASVTSKLKSEEAELCRREEVAVDGAVERQHGEFARQVESIRLMLEFTHQSREAEVVASHRQELASLRAQHRQEQETMREQFRLYRARTSTAEVEQKAAHAAELHRQRESASRLQALVEIDNKRLQQEVARLHDEVASLRRGRPAEDDLDDVGPPGSDEGL
eukprot:TRINITY_DN7805_c0_g1_i2.p1 TRINITY_DN7805_c0_g1~~TRINITY_DN7805_c0_g1_i2.p1  ORF type:complete len:260 (+),score=35.23 TRINITY_DN7805_c0_g1_i2:65-781(+)